jgi:molecular chaperone GrpE
MEEKEIKEPEEALEKKEDRPLEKKDEVTEEVVPVEKPPEERIKELEEELLQFKDKYLRLYAEFENYKRRVQKDREELLKYGVEPLIVELLTVIDNLEMALEHAGNEASLESLKEGVDLTLKELRKILNKHGVSEIEAVGKPFDPEFHHAMAQVERDDIEDKTVVEEYRKGYMLKDRVIRPSLVAVSKKVEKVEAVQSEEHEEPEANTEETEKED